jgi:hypothetical protein
VVLALLFVISGVALALCANVLRRTLQTRFAPGAAVVVTSLAAIPTLWFLGAASLVGVVIALAVTIVVFRIAAKRDDPALERMEGALLGLGVFQAILLVCALAGIYVMHTAPM